MQFQKFIEFILVSQNLSNRNSRNAEKSRFEQKKTPNSSRTPIAFPKWTAKSCTWLRRHATRLAAGGNSNELQLVQPVGTYFRPGARGWRWFRVPRQSSLRFQCDSLIPPPQHPDDSSNLTQVYLMPRKFCWQCLYQQKSWLWRKAKKRPSGGPWGKSNVLEGGSLGKSNVLESWRHVENQYGARSLTKARAAFESSRNNKTSTRKHIGRLHGGNYIRWLSGSTEIMTFINTDFVFVFLS